MGYVLRRRKPLWMVIICLPALLVGLALAQGGADVHLVQPILIEAGALPFDMEAVIGDRSDPDERVDIEIFCVSPDKWKRTISSKEFSQTLIVNGDKVYEKDSDSYFPLPIRVLATALVDPRPAIDAVRPGDIVKTKANGGADESGKTCTVSQHHSFCTMNRYGLIESVRGPGYSMDFTDYREFKGKRVARLLLYHVDPGDRLQAEVISLSEVGSYDQKDFLITEPTPVADQLRSFVVPESELRDSTLQPLEVIWPQVLEDKNTKGHASYYVSLDRTGQVREVLPISTLERTDDSARRQIMKWKFKPVQKDGVPVQAEAVLNFAYDTRAYGPASPLTDQEARKLASNIVEPVFDPGKWPSGTIYNLRIAVDEDGNIIEMIAGGEPHDMYPPCAAAIKEWHFSPIMEDGKPRPYRALIQFRVP
jgi:hypothetical protein